MKRSLFSAIIALMALALTGPALAALPVGTTAPTFTAPASLAGKTFSFSLQQALAKGPVVVYFYPAAYTRGCDLEAHTFASHHDQFDKAGATIIGVSADSIERLDKFSADPDYCAGKFAVASDPKGAIAADYGLTMTPARSDVTDVRGDKVTHGFLPRTTFVLDHDGKIVARFSSKDDHLSPVEHVTRSLTIVQQLQAKSPRS